MTLLTHGVVTVPPDVRSSLQAADVHLDERPIARLRAEDDHLAAIEFVEGNEIELDVLFAHPKQRQVPLVRSLNLALDDKGFVPLTDAPGFGVEIDLDIARRYLAPGESLV